MPTRPRSPSQMAWWMLNTTKALVLALLLLAAPVAAQQPVTGTGTAGSPATGVVTVQGNASGTPVPISGTITANLGTLNGLFLDATFTGRMPAGASPANGESNTSTSLSRIGGYNFIFNGSTWDRWTGAVTGSGNFTVTQGTGTNLHMVCDSGCSSSTAPADASTFTPSTTPQSPIGGFFQTTATNNALTNLQMGAWQMTAQRAGFVNLRNASGTEIGTSSNPVQVTLANTGANSNKILVTPDSVALPANQSVNVNQVNGAAVASPDANSYIISPNAATATAATAASVCNILGAASTNSTSCKGSAGNFYGYEIFNTTTTVYYLRLYNTAGAPTCSSATGFIRSIPIPPAAAAGQVGGIVSNQNVSANYTTGIGYCITGGSSSTDNTNAATGIFGEIRYK
jgi:hypothetical protein